MYPAADIYVGGDLNARTSTQVDYLTDEDVHYVPVPDDYTPDVTASPRVSMDNKAPNDHGWRLLDVCKSVNMRGGGVTQHLESPTSHIFWTPKSHFPHF